MRLVITGAASGIGRSVVAELLTGSVIAGEHQLLVVDRDTAGLESLADTYGDAVAPLTCDLSSPDCGDRIVRAAIDFMGGVDGLVSNAGVIKGATLAEISVEDYDQCFAINTRATWLIARALFPIMRDGGGGSIVATGSIAAHHSTPPLGAYAPSKAALVMLIKQLANEWGPHGIRCNSVSPGPTLTPMTAAGYADHDRRDERTSSIPTRRLGMPEDIANAILFLLSDRARQVTGIDLLVDGGLSTTLMSATGAGSGQGK